jgi:hypothetical protein
MIVNLSDLLSDSRQQAYTTCLFKKHFISKQTNRPAHNKYKSKKKPIQTFR